MARLAFVVANARARDEVQHANADLAAQQPAPVKICCALRHLREASHQSACAVCSKQQALFNLKPLAAMIA